MLEIVEESNPKVMVIENTNSSSIEELKNIQATYPLNGKNYLQWENLFVIPCNVSLRLEKLQRDFLWEGGEFKRRP